MQHWKALKQWRNLKYLNKVAGTRTVPIEIGSRYTDENWTQQLVNFSEFLREHISKKNEQVGYLAQHQLFDQERKIEPQGTFLNHLLIAIHNSDTRIEGRFLYTGILCLL